PDAARPAGDDALAAAPPASERLVGTLGLHEVDTGGIALRPRLTPGTPARIDQRGAATSRGALGPDADGGNPDGSFGLFPDPDEAPNGGGHDQSEEHPEGGHEGGGRDGPGDEAEPEHDESL